MKDKLGRDIMRGDTLALVCQQYGRVSDYSLLTLAKVIDVADFAIKVEEVVEKGSKGTDSFYGIITDPKRVVIVQREAVAVP